MAIERKEEKGKIIEEEEGRGRQREGRCGTFVRVNRMGLDQI
jgi:hypothetical protein